MDNGTMVRVMDNGTTDSGITKVNKETVNGIIRITAGGSMEGGTMGGFNATLGGQRSDDNIAIRRLRNIKGG